MREGLYGGTDIRYNRQEFSEAKGIRMGKKKDIILIAALLAAAGLCYLVFVALGGRGGAEAVISVDGEEIGRYPLAKERQVEIEGIGGGNRMEISGGQVKMAWADCPDQYCVRHEAVSRAGNPIVCLPHRVIITVEE